MLALLAIVAPATIVAALGYVSIRQWEAASELLSTATVTSSRRCEILVDSTCRSTTRGRGPRCEARLWTKETPC